jgi:acid stress-induced BolA-like protein IbaG/YrbA
MVPVYMDQTIARGLGLSVYCNSEDNNVFVFIKKSVAVDLNLSWYEQGSTTAAAAPAPAPESWSTVVSKTMLPSQPLFVDQEQQTEPKGSGKGSEEGSEDSEPCFCANVQVPEKKHEVFKTWNNRKIVIRVDDKDLEVTLEVLEFQGDGEKFDFTVLLWGTAHLSATEHQRQVFEELRRWLRYKNFHKFWHKGLGPTPPKRQEVFMWFQ